jgi:hypothetical protein
LVWSLEKGKSTVEKPRDLINHGLKTPRKSSNIGFSGFQIFASSNSALKKHVETQIYVVKYKLDKGNSPPPVFGNNLTL